MSSGHAHPVVLDTTVLSNFASTNSISLLIAVLDDPAVVPTVYDELKQGVAGGHDYLESAVATLTEETCVRRLVPNQELAAVRDQLDPGEAQSLLAAIEHNGTLATDDLTARKVAEKKDVPVTGSIGLLVYSIERGQLDRETANAWLDTWREQRGYYAPVKRINQVLDDEEQ